MGDGSMCHYCRRYQCECSERAVVDAIIKDISDREGLGDEWNQIDDEIKAEIRAEWVKLVHKELDKN